MNRRISTEVRFIDLQYLNKLKKKFFLRRFKTLHDIEIEVRNCNQRRYVIYKTYRIYKSIIPLADILLDLINDKKEINKLLFKSNCYHIEVFELEDNEVYERSIKIQVKAIFKAEIEQLKYDEIEILRLERTFRTQGLLK